MCSTLRVIVFFWVFSLSFTAFSENRIDEHVRQNQIDSLTQLFHATSNKAQQVKIMRNAPTIWEDYLTHADRIAELYYQAISVAESLKDTKNAKFLLLEIASLKMQKSLDEPAAFTLYTKALAYAKEDKDFTTAARICYSIAAIYEHQNFRDDMYAYFLQSIAYSEKSNELFLGSFRWLIEFYLEDNKIEEAIKIGKRGISFVEKRTNSTNFKVIMYGYYYKALKRIPKHSSEAALYKEKIGTLLTKVEKPTDIEDYEYLAMTCLEIEEYDKAIFFAKEYLRLFDKAKGLEREKIHIFEIISLGYERKGDFQSSLAFFKKYSSTYTETLKSLNSLESGRKLIRVEGERNVLIKQQEIEREKFYRNLISIVAFFMLLLGGVVFYFYRGEQKQKAELVHLNATKDRLFAILSHDLQSPIASLQTFMNLIQWGALSQKEFAESTDLFNIQLEKVRSMLENLLNWSISQMGGMKAQLASVMVEPILSSQIQLLKNQAQAKQILIHQTILPSVVIQCDSNHLTIILRNLLQNAIKFTPSGGEIHLKCFEKSDRVYLEIQDSGIGMSEQRRQHLFEINPHSSQLGTANESGTGLGLVLVKDLMEANQGTIEVKSDVGQGTTFILGFVLPTNKQRFA